MGQVRTNLLGEARYTTLSQGDRRSVGACLQVGYQALVQFREDKLTERGGHSNMPGDAGFDHRLGSWVYRKSVTTELHMDDMLCQIPNGCDNEFRNVLAHFNRMRYAQSVKKIVMPGDRGSYGGFELDSWQATQRSKKPLLLALDAYTAKLCVLGTDSRRNALSMLGKFQYIRGTMARLCHELQVYHSQVSSGTVSYTHLRAHET